MMSTTTQPPRMFFRGAECAVDAQGRVTFPKFWRLPTDDENTAFMLAPGLDRCIDVYPIERFNDILTKALSAPKTAESQNYLTIYAEHLQQITLDRQGRFAVSEQLLHYAGITKKAECIGALTYGRIFAPEHWNDIKVNQKTPPDISTINPAALTEDERIQFGIRKAIDFIGTL